MILMVHFFFFQHAYVSVWYSWHMVVAEACVSTGLCVHMKKLKGDFGSISLSLASLLLWDWCWIFPVWVGCVFNDSWVLQSTIRICAYRQMVAVYPCFRVRSSIFMMCFIYMSARDSDSCFHGKSHCPAQIPSKVFVLWCSIYHYQQLFLSYLPLSLLADKFPCHFKVSTVTLFSGTKNTSKTLEMASSKYATIKNIKVVTSHKTQRL